MDNNINGNNNKNGKLIRYHSHTKSFQSQLKNDENSIEIKRSFSKETKIIESNRNAILTHYKKNKFSNRDFYEKIRKLNKDFYNSSEKFKYIKGKLDKINDQLFMNLFQQIDLYVQEVEKLNKKTGSNNDKEYKKIINDLTKQISEKNAKIRCCEKVIKDKMTKENNLLKEIESYKRRIIFYKDKINIDLLNRNNNPNKIIYLNNTNELQNIKKSKTNNKINIPNAKSSSKIISLSPKVRRPKIKLQSSPSSDMCFLRTRNDDINYNRNSNKLNKDIIQIITEDKNESCSYITNTCPKKDINEVFEKKESIMIFNDSDKNIFNKNKYPYDIEEEKDDNKLITQENKVPLTKTYSNTQSNKNNTEFVFPLNTSYSSISIKNGENKKFQENQRYRTIEDENYNGEKLYDFQSNNVNQLSEPEQLFLEKKFFGNNNSVKNTIDYSSSNLNDSINIHKSKTKNILNTQKKINKNDIFTESSHLNIQDKKKGNYFNKNYKSVTTKNKKKRKNENIIILENGNKLKTNDNGKKKDLINSNIKGNLRNNNNKITLSYDKKSPTNTHSKKHNMKNAILKENNSTKKKSNKKTFKINESKIMENMKTAERFLKLTNSYQNFNENEDEEKASTLKSNVNKKIIDISEKEKDIKLSKILNEVNDDYKNNIDMLSRQEEQIQFILNFIELNEAKEKNH